MLKSNNIFCGDCLELMPQIGDNQIDAIVTDPPFAFAGGNSAGRASEISEQFYLHWWKDVCKEFDRILKKDGEGFIWCDWRSSSVLKKGFDLGQVYGLRLAQMIFHYRKMPGQGNPFRSSVDLIAYIRGSKSRGSRIPNTTHNLISKYWYYGKHKYHPAEKDVEIAKQLILWCSDKEDLILDPFLGSGTTAIACLETKRNFIGIDISEEYCQIATKRILEYKKTQKLTEFIPEQKKQIVDYLNPNCKD